MSMTSSPSMSRAIEAPSSSPLAISSASASATFSNRVSQWPCTASFIGPSCAQRIKFGAASVDWLLPTFRESVKHRERAAYRLPCNFSEHREESDAQNRHGPCNRCGDVGFGGHRADRVRRADLARHERVHPARGAHRAEGADGRLPRDNRRYGLRTRLVLARRLARLGLLSLLITTDWSMPL